MKNPNMRKTKKAITGKKKVNRGKKKKAESCPPLRINSEECARWCQLQRKLGEVKNASKEARERRGRRTPLSRIRDEVLIGSPILDRGN